MPIMVTEKAAKEVKKIIEEGKQAGSLNGENVYLRLSVRGGGCSGFQHKLDLDDKYSEKTDELMEQHGVGVVIDRKSLLYLNGATVDFFEDLTRRGFTVVNPTAKSTCGCGSSFSM